MAIAHPHIPSKQQTQAVPTLDTLKTGMPDLDALFEKMASGQHPDFLQFIAAVSEMVAFYTDCDSNNEDLACDLQERSQKKCLFCC